MKRRIAVTLGVAAIGFLVAGVVGLATAVVSIANASRPRQLVRWIIMPLFAAMVVATLLEGPLEQDMAFALARPMAHLLGLALAIALFVLAVTARRADPEPDPEP